MATPSERSEPEEDDAPEGGAVYRQLGGDKSAAMAIVKRRGAVRL